MRRLVQWVLERAVAPHLVSYWPGLEYVVEKEAEQRLLVRCDDSYF